MMTAFPRYTRRMLAGLMIVGLVGPVVAEETKVASVVPGEPAPATAVDSAKVTLDYRDADLANVLRSLSSSYGLNVVTSSDVKGKVTVSLHDVAVEDALEAILSANGLSYSRRGNVIYISAGAPEVTTAVSVPVRLKYLKAADAQNLLRKVLSPKGDIKVDDTSNTLLITDFPINIERVKQVVADLDMAPQQVLIEAKIVDITSKDLQNMGITWQGDVKPTGNRKGIFHRGTAFQEELKATTTLAGTSSSLSGGQIKIDALTLKGFSLTATIDALIQDQKAHLLASPSIAVINNQEARIVIGEKVPYKERTQTTTGTTETTKFIDVGTALRVTPSINADGYITVRIHPEVSSVSALLDAGPRITTREADTTVRIKEGETVVIAGLIKQENNRTKSGIPVLGQLPILDYIFGSRSKDHTQTELAVFITPKILRSRDELKALAADEARQAAARVTLPTAGELGVVLTLLQKAQRLEWGWGVESRRKPAWFRAAQAVNLYEHIAEEFPDSPQAPEALLRAATLRFRALRDPDGARAVAQRLLAAYPNHVTTPAAQALIAQIEPPQTAARTIVLHEKAQGRRRQRAEEAELQRQSQQLAQTIVTERRHEQEVTRRDREAAAKEQQAEAARAEHARQQQDAEARRQPAEATKAQQAQDRQRAREEAQARAEAAKADRLKQQEAVEAKRQQEAAQRHQIQEAERLRRQQEADAKRQQAEQAKAQQAAARADRAKAQEEAVARREQGRAQAVATAQAKREQAAAAKAQQIQDRQRAREEAVARRQQEIAQRAQQANAKRQQAEQAKAQQIQERQRAREEAEARRREARDRADRARADRLRARAEQWLAEADALTKQADEISPDPQAQDPKAAALRRKAVVLREKAQQLLNPSA